MSRKYIMRNKEEKLAVIKRNLAEETALSLAKEIEADDRAVRDWMKKYLSDGNSGLETNDNLLVTKLAGCLLKK